VHPCVRKLNFADAEGTARHITHKISRSGIHGSVQSRMSCSDWRSDIAVVAGVALGILLALWFSSVVAMGPPSGAALSKKSEQSAQAQGKTAAPDQQPPFRIDGNEKQVATNKVPECSNDGQSSYHDCLIQLRPARAAERQADEAHTAGRIASVALLFAAVAAAAALWTVHVMRWTAKRQLRAYVVLDHAVISNLFGDRPTVVVIFKNCGQTPAYSFSTHVSVQVFAFPYRGPFEPTPITRSPSVSIVGSQATNSAPAYASRRMTAAEEASIRSGRFGVYAFGAATYTDVFNQRHTTQFRVMCGGVTGILDGMMANCDEGNDAD